SCCGPFGGRRIVPDGRSAALVDERKGRPEPLRQWLSDAAHGSNWRRRNQGGYAGRAVIRSRPGGVPPASTMRSLATHPMTQPMGASDHLGEAFAAGPIRRLEENVGRVLRGKPEAI